MVHAERLRITVVYALPEGPFVREMLVPPGTTVRQAVERSGLLQSVPSLDLGALAAGVWGRLCPLEQLLADGDRVEVYRPLECDPKHARRARAAG
jgi:uncharacterized protein